MCFLFFYPGLPEMLFQLRNGAQTRPPAGAARAGTLPEGFIIQPVANYKNAAALPAAEQLRTKLCRIDLAGNITF